MTVDLTKALPADWPPLVEEAERRANRGPWGTVHPEHYMHRSFERETLRDITRPETRDWLARLVNGGEPCLVRLMWRSPGVRALCVFTMDGMRFITEDDCPPLRHLGPNDHHHEAQWVALAVVALWVYGATHTGGQYICCGVYGGSSGWQSAWCDASEHLAQAWAEEAPDAP